VRTIIISQNLITDKDRAVWTFKNGYTYDFEWTTEADDDKCFKDTIYAIQFFPKKNDWKVYFDLNKTKIATLLHFDTINKTINTKHFNRQGKLIKELEANYTNRKNYNPAFIKVENVIYLKAYLNDTLIYEIKGHKTSLYIKYQNFKTKRHFEKTTYYAEDKDFHRDEEIGGTFIDYYENGKIKSYCSRHTVKETNKDGVTICVSVSDCKEFDNNGCMIQEK
jgi:hypothetical protein